MKNIFDIKSKVERHIRIGVRERKVLAKYLKLSEKEVLQKIKNGTLHRLFYTDKEKENA